MRATTTGDGTIAGERGNRGAGTKPAPKAKAKPTGQQSPTRSASATAMNSLGNAYAKASPEPPASSGANTPACSTPTAISFPRTP
jgi:hypothetical protein